MSRPRALPLVIVTLAIALVVASATAGSAKSDDAKSAFASIPNGTQLSVGDQSTTLQTPLELSGQATKLPYSIKYANFVGGPPMLEAFNAGALDVGWMADLPTLTALAAGLDIKIVAAATDTGNNMKIVAAKGSGIKKLADLKGKSVAYAKGTSIQAFLGAALEKADLTFSDISSVTLPPTAGDFSAAFQSGGVDAAAFSSVWYHNYVAQNPGALTVVSEATGLTTGLTFLVTTSKVLNDPVKEAAIADFITRQAKAQHWVAANRETWVSTYSVGVLKLDRTIAERTLDESGVRQWLPIDTTTVTKMQSLADLVYRAQAISKPVKVKALFDKRYNPTVAAVATSTAAATK